MLSYRRETALQGGLVMANSGRLKLGDNILRTMQVYLRLLWRNWPAKHSNSVEKMQNIRAITPSKVILGYRGRYQSKAVYDFLVVINDILSRTVSELLQLIVKIWKSCVFDFLWGLRDNVQCSSWAHWKLRSGLSISVNWTFSAGVTTEAPRAKIYWKSAISFWPKNSSRKGRPPWGILRFWAPYGGLGATYDDHLRLIGKRIVY